VASTTGGPGGPDAPPVGSSTDPVGLSAALRADPFGLATHRHGEDPEPAPGSSGWALARLGLVLAAIIGLGYLAGVGETVLLVFALFACILLHELGHFLTAKAARIRVTEFFVGFGPRLWSIRRGETEYGVKALPLGGYCRIVGMHNLDEVEPEYEARTYRQKPVWRRLSVSLAGSAMHFLIALCVLFAMFFWTGDAGNYLPIPASSPIIAIDRLSTGPSPAQKAGFELGDRVLAVDGHHFSTFEQLATFVEARPDTRLAVLVDQHGKRVVLHPTTANLAEVEVRGVGASALRTTKPTGFLGIEVSDVVHSSFTASISEAGGAFVHESALTLDAFSRLLTLHGISDYAHMLVSPKAAAHPADGVRFESPVGIVRLLHTAAGDGLPTVLFLLAVINLSLGLFNLIPLLPLDGGHVAIALYEGVRSRRHRPYHADVAKLLPLFYLAIAALVFLAVSSLFLDIRSLLI